MTMELVHDFTVPVGVDTAWEVLTDIERVVPCMPGANVTAVDGDTFEGGMKLKLGPIGMTFKGQGAFVQKDPASHTAVIEAKGRDAKGNGGAQALVTAALTEASGATTVHVVTDLNVTGKAAQFGTGVMNDVSNRLLAQFAANLATQLVTDTGPQAPTPTGAAAAASARAAVDTTERPAASSVKTAAPQPNTGDGLDLTSLLFGSEATKSAIRSVATVVVSLAFGYLWGKNRVLERQARNA